jgi:hypothetical protein
MQLYLRSFDKTSLRASGNHWINWAKSREVRLSECGFSIPVRASTGNDWQSATHHAFSTMLE